MQDIIDMDTSYCGRILRYCGRILPVDAVMVTACLLEVWRYLYLVTSATSNGIGRLCGLWYDGVTL